MKIALVILHADSARGGAERYTIDLAESLANRGHDVAVLASSFQSRAISGRAVLIASRGRTRTGRYNAFLNSLDRELETGHYDLVHAMLPVRRCDVYHPHAGIAADVVSSGHRSKSGFLRSSIAWLGNRINRRRLRFAGVERELLSSTRPPVVLCLSELIRRVVHDRYPAFPPENLVRLFNGTNLAKFDPLLDPLARARIRGQFNIQTDAIVALMLAQDFERKGLRQAIEAVAQLTDQRIRLLVGGKPDPAQYLLLAKSLGIADRIIFAGQVSDPVAFYKAADLFVLPTRFDPCSLVVLEALAMGVPVISTAQNGACEIMQNGVHGFVLPQADDVPALAQSIHKLTDHATRSRMSAACLQLRPVLSQENHLACLEETYARILTSRTEV